MPDSRYVLELRNVSRGFGAQSVLRDISFGVEPGQSLVLIGESGCGKSVTTKLLAGLLTPDSGGVYWNGQPVKQMPRPEMRSRRLKFGFLFQGAALFDSLTFTKTWPSACEQNVACPKVKFAKSCTNGCGSGTVDRRRLTSGRRSCPAA